MEKPNLLQHQYAVVQAERSTGHVLKNDKSLFLVGDDILQTYGIFDSYDQAKDFSIKRVQNDTDIECCIYDHAGQVVFFYDKDGVRNLTP